MIDIASHRPAPERHAPARRRPRAAHRRAGVPLATLAIALSAVLALSAALTACGNAGSSAGPRDIVLVVDNHTGSPALTSADVRPYLADLDDGDRVAVVVADGDPTIRYDKTVTGLPGNSARRASRLDEYRGTATAAALSSYAEAPQSDVAEAISLATTVLRPEARSHTIVYTGSGLSTAGVLAMTDSRLYAPDLVTRAAQSRLPDLSGWTLVLPRLAVVASPQAELTTEARDALTSIWKQYLTAAGAKDVRLTQTASRVGTPIDASLPQVTPVKVARPQPAVAAGCGQVLLDATMVSFATDSAKVADLDGTRALLEKVAAGRARCDGVWVVSGSASTPGTVEHNLQLSRARASTIAEVLSDVTGTPVGDMRVVAYGVNWPCRVPDQDAGGAWIIDGLIHNQSVSVVKTTNPSEPGC